MSNILLYRRSLPSEFRVVMSATISDKKDVRFVFTSSCLYEGACLIGVIYVCLSIVEFIPVLLVGSVLLMF